MSQNIHFYEFYRFGTNYTTFSTERQKKRKRRNNEFNMNPSIPCIDLVDRNDEIESNYTDDDQLSNKREYNRLKMENKKLKEKNEKLKNDNEYLKQKDAMLMKIYLNGQTHVLANQIYKKEIKKLQNTINNKNKLIQKLMVDEEYWRNRRFAEIIYDANNTLAFFEPLASHKMNEILNNDTITMPRIEEPPTKKRRVSQQGYHSMSVSTQYTN